MTFNYDTMLGAACGSTQDQNESKAFWSAGNSRHRAILPSRILKRAAPRESNVSPQRTAWLVENITAVCSLAIMS